MVARVAEKEVFYVINNPASITHQPHDKFFKTIMSDKRVVRDFLNAYLPQDVKQIIDFENMELQRRSYLSAKCGMSRNRAVKVI